MKIIIPHSPMMSWGSAWYDHHEGPGLPHFTLAHVCKTLRAEILPILVARTEFRIWFDQVSAFIGCWILPPNIEVEQAVGRVVVEPHQLGHRTIDVKPLLLLSEAAKGTEIVFKHVLVKDWDARDYTVQELLETLLGADSSSFSGCVREAGCSMMLDVTWYTTEVKTYILIKELKTTLPERYWKPWMTQWGSQDYREQSLDRIVKNIKDRGIGMGPPFTAYWDPMRNARFYKQDRWVERLT